ncbi:hypothetical protein DL96DRAFT_1752631, partial [Flagelloscypha sp. PMI_526]
MGILDSPTKRARIVTMKKAGVKNSKIQAEVSGSVSQINRLHRKWKNQTQFYGKTPGRGRPRALSEQDIRRIACLLHTGKAESVRDVNQRFYTDVEERTIRRALHEKGIHGFRSWQVPLI